MTNLYKWEFPGGKVEPGETAQNALKRGMMEERSIVSKINDQIIVIRFSFDTYEINLTLIDVSITEGELNLNAHHSVQWTPIDEMKNLEWLAVDYPLISKVKNYIMKTNKHPYNDERLRMIRSLFYTDLKCKFFMVLWL